MIRDDKAAKRWGLILLFVGYLLHLAASVGIPSRPWIGAALWIVAAVGAVLYTFVTLRQLWRQSRSRNQP